MNRRQEGVENYQNQKRQDFADAGLPAWSQYGAVPGQAFQTKSWMNKNV
jgi:hypothetical protein